MLDQQISSTWEIAKKGEHLLARLRIDPAPFRAGAHASRLGPLLIPRHALDILAKLRLKPTGAQAPLR